MSPYIEKGMTVLDIGCGPGFFSVDMAHLVGESGRVIAVDLQEDQLGVSEQVDFILVFYMFHEVTHQDGFLDEIGSLLKPEGRVLIVEPPFHVSTSAFKEMIAKARNSGLQPVESPKIFLGKAVVLKRVNKALDSEGPDGDRSQSLTHDS